LKSQAEGIGRQLRGWADSLQNSEIKGQRYLTDRSRRIEQDKRDREKFAEEFRQAQMENIASTRSKPGARQKLA